MATETPFSRALDQWKASLKTPKDKESPFYQQVVTVQKISSGSKSQDDTAKFANDLSLYIQELQKTRQSESRFAQLCTKLEPFVNSITGLMKICGPVLQAAPVEVALAFAGAQLVLQLAAKHAAAFEKMVDIMTEIGRNLRCYDKMSAAYEASAELGDLLLDAYLTIIGFWNRASQVLSKSCKTTLLSSEQM
jgi:hypothetical protein